MQAAHISDAASAASPPSVSRFWVYPLMFTQYFALGLLRPEMPQILMELFEGNMQHVAVSQCNILQSSHHSMLLTLLNLCLDFFLCRHFKE